MEFNLIIKYIKVKAPINNKEKYIKKLGVPIAYINSVLIELYIFIS